MCVGSLAENPMNACQQLGAKEEVSLETRLSKRLYKEIVTANICLISRVGTTS